MNSGSGAITGGAWGDQVKFDPHAGYFGLETYTIAFNSLIDEMSELIDANEKILEISVYKRPLSKWQLTQALLNHQFVVLKTTNRWWSIEKDCKQIDIRRGESLEAVKDYDLKGERITPVVIMSKDEDDEGTKSMKDLIEFLYKKDEVLKTYHWITDNCQGFAKRVFDQFAVMKQHNIVLGDTCQC